MDTLPDTGRVESEADLAAVELVRSGDEEAFVALVRRYNGLLIRVARRYTGSHAVAEEAAQEAWISVLRGIGTFEGRSSFRTWLLTILVNCARRRASAERRATPTGSLDGNDGDNGLDPGSFFPADHARWAGMWTTCVSSWAEVPDERFLARETMDHIRAAIDQLPPVQRAVVALRDVCGLSAAEVCSLLDLTDANGRVLLHRARGRLRRSLERYVEASC